MKRMLDRKTTIRIAMIDEFGMPWIFAHTIEPCRRQYHSWAVREQTGWRIQSEDCATLQLRTEHEIAKQKEDADRSSIIGIDCIRIVGSCLGSRPERYNASVYRWAFERHASSRTSAKHDANGNVGGHFYRFDFRCDYCGPDPKRLQLSITECEDTKGR